MLGKVYHKKIEYQVIIKSYKLVEAHVRNLLLLHSLLCPHVRGRCRFSLEQVQLRESNCTITLKKQQALQPLRTLRTAPQREHTEQGE